jgi:hypothetical protein
MGSRYVGKLSERKNNGMRTVIGMTIGLAVMAGAVQTQTFINTCPFVISSPGRYVLTADLICGGGDGITITSSDVTLALEGHRITAGVGANIAIRVNPQAGPALARVRILGPGLITNGGGNTFLDGVSLFIVTDSEVSGITVLGSRSAGIGAAGPLAGADMTITANTLGRNGLGMSVFNLRSSTISENDISGNGVGISITNADASGPPLIVSHNILNGNTGNGVQIDAGLIGLAVTVQNNVVNGNGLDGIHVDSLPPLLSGSTEVVNNTSLANGRNDLFDGAPGCSGNVWSGNTFFNANQSCIH